MTITPLPPAPARTDAPDVFSAKADALLAQLVNAFVSEMNIAINEVNAGLATNGVPGTLDPLKPLRANAAGDALEFAYPAIVPVAIGRFDLNSGDAVALKNHGFTVGTPSVLTGILKLDFAVARPDADYVTVVTYDTSSGGLHPMVRTQTTTYLDILFTRLDGTNSGGLWTAGPGAIINVAVFDTTP